MPSSSEQTILSIPARHGRGQFIIKSIDSLLEFGYMIYEVTKPTAGRPWTFVQFGLDGLESREQLIYDMYGLDAFNDDSYFMARAWEVLVPRGGPYNPDNFDICLANEPSVTREPAYVVVRRIRTALARDFDLNFP